MPIPTKPHKGRNRFIHFDDHFGIYCSPGLPIPPSGVGEHIAYGKLENGLARDKPKANECRIFADGEVVLSRGYECGWIWHFNLLPPPPAPPVPSINMLLPLIIAGSSNKCVFAVGSVIGTHGPIAVSAACILGFNLSCQDSLPNLRALVFNLSGSVYLGFTLGDYVSSRLYIFLTMLTSMLANGAAKWLTGFLPKGLLKPVVLPLLGKAGLPKVYRGDLGRFASVTEKLVKDTFSGAVEGALGDLIENSSRTFNLMESAADALGAWIDGRSEHFASRQ